MTWWKSQYLLLQVNFKWLSQQQNLKCWSSLKPDWYHSIKNVCPGHPVIKLPHTADTTQKYYQHYYLLKLMMFLMSFIPTVLKWYLPIQSLVIPNGAFPFVLPSQLSSTSHGSSSSCSVFHYRKDFNSLLQDKQSCRLMAVWNNICILKTMKGGTTLIDCLPLCGSFSCKSVSFKDDYKEQNTVLIGQKKVWEVTHRQRADNGGCVFRQVHVWFPILTHWPSRGQRCHCTIF